MGEEGRKEGVVYGKWDLVEGKDMGIYKSLEGWGDVVRGVKEKG